MLLAKPRGSESREAPDQNTSEVRLTEPTLSLWHQSTVPAVESSVSSLLTPSPGSLMGSPRTTQEGCPSLGGSGSSTCSYMGHTWEQRRQTWNVLLTFGSSSHSRRCLHSAAHGPDEDTHWSRTLTHTPPFSLHRHPMLLKELSALPDPSCHQEL